MTGDTAAARITQNERTKKKEAKRLAKLERKKEKRRKCPLSTLCGRKETADLSYSGGRSVPQAAMLFAATRLVLLASLVPNLLVAALRLTAEARCFLMVVF
jgi:hypothetical protein